MTKYYRPTHGKGGWDAPKKDPTYRNYHHLASMMQGPINPLLYYIQHDDPDHLSNYDYSDPDTLMYFYVNRDMFPTNIKDENGKIPRYITVEYDVNADAANRFNVSAAETEAVEEQIRESWMVDIEHVIGLQLDLLDFVRAAQLNILTLSNLTVDITSGGSSSVQSFARKANDINLEVYRTMTNINHTTAISSIMRAFMGPLIHFPGDPRFYFHGKSREIDVDYPLRFTRKFVIDASAISATNFSRGIHPVDLEYYFEFMVERRATPLKDYFVSKSLEQAQLKAKTMNPVPTGLAFEKLWWDEFQKEGQLWTKKFIPHKDFENASLFPDLHFQWDKNSLYALRKKMMLLIDIQSQDDQNDESE